MHFKPKCFPASPEEDGSLVLVQPAFLGHGGQVGGHGIRHGSADEEDDQQAEHGAVEQAEVQHSEDPLQQLPRHASARAARDQESIVTSSRTTRHADTVVATASHLSQLAPFSETLS